MSAPMTRDEVLRIVREARKRGERPDLTGADLRWVNLTGADGGVLAIDGLPSGPDPVHSDNPERVDDVHAGVLSAAQGDRGPWEDDELTYTDNRSDPR